LAPTTGGFTVTFSDYYFFIPLRMVKDGAAGAVCCEMGSIGY